MLRETSRIELALWFAHVKMGSMDDEKADIRMAVIASAARNGPHFMKTDKRPYLPIDFLPDAPRRDVVLSKEIRSIFQRMGK